MPSAFESLSIFVLEAWAYGTPVLVNAKCKVLEGQCRRSQGGLYYRDLAEFAAMMRLLMSQPALREQLGAAGTRLRAPGILVGDCGCANEWASEIAPGSRI
jgi:glycosyltransferase involved in cell wall biosynthesis